MRAVTCDRCGTAMGNETADMAAGSVRLLRRTLDLCGACEGEAAAWVEGWLEAKSAQPTTLEQRLLVMHEAYRAKGKSRMWRVRPGVFLGWYRYNIWDQGVVMVAVGTASHIEDGRWLCGFALSPEVLEMLNGPICRVGPLLRLVLVEVDGLLYGWELYGDPAPRTAACVDLDDVAGLTPFVGVDWQAVYSELEDGIPGWVIDGAYDLMDVDWAMFAAQRGDWRTRDDKAGK